LSLRFAGWLSFRQAARTFLASLIHDPPRMTRFAAAVRLISRFNV
jgi:hypothetical protein